jgi:hypothetical protein
MCSSYLSLRVSNWAASTAITSTDSPLFPIVCLSKLLDIGRQRPSPWLLQSFPSKCWFLSRGWTDRMGT